jgi:hypothetical protein
VLNEDVSIESVINFLDYKSAYHDTLEPLKDGDVRQVINTICRNDNEVCVQFEQIQRDSDRVDIQIRTVNGMGGDIDSLDWNVFFQTYHNQTLIGHFQRPVIHFEKDGTIELSDSAVFDIVEGAVLTLDSGDDVLVDIFRDTLIYTKRFYKIDSAGVIRVVRTKND